MIRETQGTNEAGTNFVDRFFCFVLFFFIFVIHTLKLVYSTGYTTPERCERFQTMKHLFSW